MPNILPQSFYEKHFECHTAKLFLGKILVTCIQGIICKGRIVEVELYKAENDRACHAFGGRKTPRNAVMYKEAGLAYTYICYGTHVLFNLTLNQKHIPDALLVRALEPLEGIPAMLKRCQEKKLSPRLTKGPGKLSKAMGITMQMNGQSLLSKTLFLEEDNFSVQHDDIITTPRIGVQGAGVDANLPYRFFLKGNPYVSGKKNIFQYHV